jgi:hypothetical protein
MSWVFKVASGIYHGVTGAIVVIWVLASIVIGVIFFTKFLILVGGLLDMLSRLVFG